MTEQNRQTATEAETCQCVHNTIGWLHHKTWPLKLAAYTPHLKTPHTTMHTSCLRSTPSHTEHANQTFNTPNQTFNTHLQTPTFPPVGGC